MYIQGVEVAHAGNLVVIEGPNKSGKTAFYGAGIASILAKDGDFLGWESDGNPQRHAVLHFDSEQSRGDHDAVVRRAMGRANCSTTPEWFDSFCLTGWELSDSKLAIDVAMEDALAKFGGVHSLWIDGGADFVASVNDETEALAWVRKLHGLSLEYKCPIFVILHLNPSGVPGIEKSRGHLGSQIDRKAETVLRLTKEGSGTTNVSTRYARRAPISVDAGPQFAFDPVAGIHQSIAIRRDTKEDKLRSELKALADDVYRENSDPFGMSWKDLATQIQRRETIDGKVPSRRTIERRIAAMAKAGVVTKTQNGNYVYRQ